MTLRCAGARWRLLAHEPDGDSHSVGPTRKLAGEDRPHLKTHVLPGTEFDELVVGQGFLHIEQMGSGSWWMNIGGLVVNVQVDRDGRPRAVMAELEPVDGVKYDLDL